MTDMKPTWLKYLDMVRFDREELQATLKIVPWTRDKYTYSRIGEESHLKSVSVFFCQFEPEVDFEGIF